MDQVILWACLCFLIHLFLFSLTESFYCSHFVIEFIVESWVTYSTYLCKQRIWLLSPLRKSVSNRRNQGLCGNAIPTIFAVTFIFLILCHQLSPGLPCLLGHWESQGVSFAFCSLTSHTAVWENNPNTGLQIGK